MSILTGLVIVVAMATLAQRSDSLLDFVMREEAPKVAPQNDEAVMFAGDARVIDVLQNDENAAPENRENVRIVVSPSCGAAEATSEGVLYISNELCVGPQLFAYCVQQGDECPSASVTVNVAAAAPGTLQLSRQDQATTTQSQAPAAAPQITAAASPSRQPSVGTGSTASAPRIVDETAAPRVAAANPSSRSSPSAGLGAAPQAPTQEQPFVERNTVVAAVRPEAPARVPVGRLASAPLIDDGSVDGPAPSLSALSDDSEPDVIGAASRPSFTAPRDEAGITGGNDAGGEAEAVRVAALPSATGEATEVQPSAAQPDVSAIATQPSEPEAPLTEVARLQDPSNGDSAAAIRDDAVSAARRPTASGDAPTARLQPTQPVTGAVSAPSSAGCGPVETRSIASAGAFSRVSIASACRANAAYVIEHAGLSFGGRLDEAGNGDIEIPVMAENGAAAIRFTDGSGERFSLNFNWRELELTLRVAVAWTDPVDLDLHAFEYAAPFGADGHVWEESPSGFRRVRRSGGGYLANYPATTEGGQSVEVYTFWANSRARRGVARIALDHASRGDVPDGAYCADGPLASPEYVVVRSERGDVKSTARGRFSPAACGLALTQDARYASGALRDLRID
ncbi:MAG: hypothetical protein AAFN79_16645 [Pseudomonadota bacterium]